MTNIVFLELLIGWLGALYIKEDKMLGSIFLKLRTGFAEEKKYGLEKVGSTYLKKKTFLI